MKKQYGGREIFKYANKIGRVLNNYGLEKEWFTIGSVAVVTHLYSAYGDEAFDMWERKTDDIDIVAKDFSVIKGIVDAVGGNKEKSHIPYKYNIKGGHIKVDLYLPTEDGKKIMIEDKEISPKFFERAKKIGNIYVPELSDLISLKESVRTETGGPRESDKYDIELLRGIKI